MSGIKKITNFFKPPTREEIELDEMKKMQKKIFCAYYIFMHVTDNCQTA